MFLVLRVLNLLAVFRVFAVLGMFRVLLGRVRHRFRRAFSWRFRVFGLGGRRRIAGRGQGTAGLAAAGMASAAASGSTPATRCCRIGWL
jgi:hypothetical protein